MLLMMMSVAAGLAACQTSSSANKSKVKQIQGGQDAAMDADDDSQDEVLGLNLDLNPARSVISVVEGEPPQEVVYDQGGHEYWLKSASGGNTGCVVYGSNGTYRPYGNGCQNEEYLAMRPSETARRCMWQASQTLKAMRANPPQEFIDFNEKYGSSGSPPFSFFGWIDDYHTLQSSASASQVYQGPFNWKAGGEQLGDEGYQPSGYVKWHGVILADGTCLTPSVGQFIRVLKIMENCTENPGNGCQSI